MYLIKYSDLNYTLVVIDDKNNDNKVYHKVDSAIALSLIEKGCKFFVYVPKEK